VCPGNWNPLSELLFWLLVLGETSRKVSFEPAPRDSNDSVVSRAIPIAGFKNSFRFLVPDAAATI